MPKTQLTRQIGEHFVVAELGRNEIIATPFAGNMPEYDIVAHKLGGTPVFIQVKAINKGDWQLNAAQFLEIEYDKTQKTQRCLGLKSPSVSPLHFVLVQIRKPGTDEIYVASFASIQQIVLINYRRVSGKSTHFALKKRHVPQFKVKELGFSCFAEAPHA